MKRITILKRAKIDLEEIARIYHRNRNLLLYDNPQSYVIENDYKDDGWELVTPIDSLEEEKKIIWDIFKKYEWSDVADYDYEFWRLEKAIDAMKNYYLMFNIDDENDTGIRTINIFDLRKNLSENLKAINDGEDATEVLIRLIDEDIEKEKENK